MRFRIKLNAVVSFQSERTVSCIFLLLLQTIFFCFFFIFLFNYIFIEVWLVYNVVLVYTAK